MNKWMFWMVLVLASPLAKAAVGFSQLDWRADGQFELTLEAGSPVIFKGNLQADNAVLVKVGAIQADIHAWGKQKEFVTVVLTEDRQKNAAIFLLQNVQGFKKIGTQNIVGRKATASLDLDESIQRLMEIKQWNYSIILPKIAAYIAAHPNQNIDNFADQIEMQNAEILDGVQPTIDLESMDVMDRTLLLYKNASTHNGPKDLNHLSPDFENIALPDNDFNRVPRN